MSYKLMQIRFKVQRSSPTSENERDRYRVIKERGKGNFVFFFIFIVTILVVEFKTNNLFVSSFVSNYLSF